MSQSYNLLTEPWIEVRYLDGRHERVSLTTCFKDAKEIKELTTPVFRGEHVWIYDVPLMLLLTTITTAAYFKPEHHFRLKSLYELRALQENGFDLEVILPYLQKYHDKFDLFSEDHPFLQNIRLKNHKEQSVFMTNPLAPAQQAKIFGRVRSIGEAGTTDYAAPYQMSVQEFAYNLLYQNALGVSPMSAKYPNRSLCSAATEFIQFRGETLEQTILVNCVPLSTSAYPTEDEPNLWYDRPIWEIDDIEDIRSAIEFSQLANQRLLCMFFPSFPMLGKYDSSQRCVRIALSNTINDAVLTKDERETLSNSYIDKNDYALRKTNKPKKGEDPSSVYCTFAEENTALELCMLATTRNAHGMGCGLIEHNSDLALSRPSRIYYRKFDDYKCNLEGMGVMRIPQHVFDTLSDTALRKVAERYQDLAKNIRSILRYAYKTADLLSASEKVGNVYESAYSKAKLNDLSFETERIFFSTFLQRLPQEQDKEKVLRDSILLLCDKTTDIFEQAFKSCRPMQFAKARRNLSWKLYDLKKKEGFLDEGQ